jgi:hypothetical protein
MLSSIIASICGISSDHWKATMESMTGLSNHPLIMNMSSCNTAASSFLRKIRNHVSSFPKCSNADDAAVVLELGELLDEIQETIDTADADSAGLQDVARMKKMAVEAASHAHPDEEQDGFGVTTQIGFDGARSGSLPATNNNSHESMEHKFGNTNGSGVNGMMIVKKKTKRDESKLEESVVTEEKKMKPSM